MINVYEGGSGARLNVCGGGSVCSPWDGQT